MSPPALTIHLFGPLRVLVHGEPMQRVRSRSVEWLLALLALRYGRTLDRAWLAGTLWPESEEGQALRNLRDVLVPLRKALGSESARIHSPSRDTLTFDLEGAEVDLVRFDAAIKAGDEDSLRRAVEVYTGPLLEGCYEAWVSLERENREQAFLAALETLAQWQEERADYPEAIRYLRQAEAMDPLRDSIARRLMASLAAAGDLAAAVEVYRSFRNRLHAELAATPDVETTRLFHEIRVRGRETPHLPLRLAAPSPPGLASSAHLLARPPYPLSPLIGREQELESLRQRLSQSRLVTLIGAGGVGKTRLAMEVAAHVEEEFEGRAVWVELASLAEGALLLPALAAALGVRQEGGSDPQTLLRQVVSQLSDNVSLLALDNCEHHLDAIAVLVQQLLSRCPGLRVLTTSRQRLGLAGEVAWRVPSLSVPEAGVLSADPSEASTAALTYPAIRLFVERASAVREGFRLASIEEVEAVCQVCRRLDGIPLALELAAARANILSVAQIASRLDDRFRLLTGGRWADSPRHRTLQALIDWSHDLLSAAEQGLLRCLSVFAGGWSLEAAEAVFGVESDRALTEGAEVLDVMASLVDRSLVVVEELPGGLRYRMLETIREYGQQKLRESGEAEAVWERHADYFLQLGERSRPLLVKPDVDCMDRLEVEHDNLRAALTYYAGKENTVDKAVRLAAALAPFWNARGHYYEVRAWLVGLAQRPTPSTAARAELLAWAARVFVDTGDYDNAKRMFMENLEIVQQLGDRVSVVNARNALAGVIGGSHIAGPEYDPGTARALVEESLALSRELGYQKEIAHCLFLLGQLAAEMGNSAEARTRWMECRAQDQEMGVKGGFVLWALGELALKSGDCAQTRHFYACYLTERYEIGDRWSAAWSLEGFCRLALTEGCPERAARLLGASIALRESFAHSLSEVERASYETLLGALREALGETALCVAWMEGRAMALEQAIAYALAPA